MRKRAKEYFYVSIYCKLGRKIHATAAKCGLSAYLYIQTNFTASFLDNGSNVVHAELLSELVEDTHLSPIGWIVDSKLDAAHLQGTLQVRTNSLVQHT